ncbi:MAG: TolC family protein, partial [Moraxellaceae bacterium]
MKKYIVPCLFLLLAGRAVAQPLQQPQELTLQEAISYALTNNETVKKAQLDQKSAEYLVKEVRGSGLPQLNGTGQVSAYPSLPTQLLPGELAGQPAGTYIPVQFGTKYTVNGGVELQQLLFSQSYFVGLKAAQSTKDLYALRTQMSKEDLIYNIGSAYYQVLQAKEQFNTLDANYDRLQQLENILQLQRENDLARKVDVNRITVNKTNLENQRQTLTATLEQAENALKFFMGMPMDQEIEVADSPNALDQVIPVSDQANSIIAQRTDFQLLNKQRDLNLLNIKNIQSGYYPTLAGFGQYSYQAQRNEFNFLKTGSQYPWFNTFVVGLQLNVPIFDGFQRKYKIKQAQVEVMKLDQDLQQLRQRTQMGLDNASRQM